MMIWLVVGVGACLFLVWSGQFAFARLFAGKFRHSAPCPPAGPMAPKFAVLMPLRGADSHLPVAIQSVLGQKYPNFELHVVIDHENDPALKVVTEIIRQRKAENVRVSVLRDRQPTCSLLCSNLLQFLNDLDDSVEMIAFCAADMVAPANWLREMAAAMSQPEVGVTLGNRWYMPDAGGWGTLARYLWNAGAVVPMWFFQLPWGGAVSLRVSDVRRSKLAETWERGMVEDAPIHNAVRELGLQLQFVPQLIVVNREEVSLRSCFNFFKRQLLWTRLYHPHWNMVVANTVFFTTAMFAALAAAVAAAAVGQFTAALAAAAVEVAYVAGQMLLLGEIERPILRMLRGRGEAVVSLSRSAWWRLWLAIPLTQLMQAAALVQCLFIRCIDWRGVSYRIHGPGSVQMIEYRPFAGS